MTIVVRRSAAEDRPAILALMDAARAGDLSAQERARRGFVQGTMDEAKLARLQEGTGVFVAEESGALAGFAMTAHPGEFHAGPPRLAVDAVRSITAGPRPALFLYGPAAVDRRWQGRGVLTSLLTTLCRSLSGTFDLAVAFVERANERSLVIHRHYGMDEAAAFQYDGRDYAVFTFAPGLFVSRGA